MHALLIAINPNNRQLECETHATRTIEGCTGEQELKTTGVRMEESQRDSQMLQQELQQRDQRIQALENEKEKLMQVESCFENIICF